MSRIAIVNRGEAAMRLIHAAREYGPEHGRPITTIALYTESDAGSAFVREADEAVLLGRSMVVDPRDGLLRNGYLDYRALKRALEVSHADAAWVGWGFVAEDPRFAELCARLGVLFIGPPADVMRRLGDKIAAKRLAEGAGIPVALWSGGPVSSATEALEVARRLGLPLMVKAAAGGGGRGIRRVDHLEDVVGAFERAADEARASFGDPTIFMEKLILEARHIEVQIVADNHGQVWAVGVRDCTLQRHNQKVIEESASTALTVQQEAALSQAACRLALDAGYRGAGTVEFLYQPFEKVMSFMEVNARLQVEHPVTEATTGLDLVKLQLHIAEGGRLDGEPPPRFGHAIEARIYAEDPQDGFAPAPGRIALLRLPGGPGVRVDTGVAEGDSIPPDFDGMIAKLIAWGHDRQEALVRLRRALYETTVVIKGGSTNRGFLLDLLGRPEVGAGNFDNAWLDRLAGSGETRSDRYLDVALAMAGIEAHDSQLLVDEASFFVGARQGSPKAVFEVPPPVVVRVRGTRYAVEVCRRGPSRYRVRIGTSLADADLYRSGPFTSRMVLAGRRFRITCCSTEIEHRVEVEGVAHRLERYEPHVVRSPVPGLVVAVPVTVGDEVNAGDPVAVIETMKMETTIMAPAAGRVAAILASANVLVAAGAVLVRFDTDSGSTAPSPGTSWLTFPALSPPDDQGERGSEATEETLRHLFLGYDIDDAEALDAARMLTGTSEGQTELLSLFSDLRNLFRSSSEAGDADLGVSSRREQFFTYLRTLDPTDGTLANDFLEDLTRAVAHYGVRTLDPCPELHDALFLIFRSQQRVEAQASVVIAILKGLLDASSGPPSEQLRTSLDGLVAASDHHLPVIRDFAREIRFQLFNAPILAEARNGMYTLMNGHLVAAARVGDGDGFGVGRASHIDALVACPYPLAPMLLGNVPVEDEALASVALEVMTRRYYRKCRPRQFHTNQTGHPFIQAEYDDAGPVQLLAAACSMDQLAGAAADAARLADECPAAGRVTVDLYASRPGAAAEPDEMAEYCATVVSGAAFAARVDRVVVVVGQAGTDRRIGSLQHYTFQRSDDGFFEDRFLRGLHPMMADRLELSRLRGFEISRLVAPDDIYLFQARARTNPSDERLFAFAEVRDLTPQLGTHGQVVELPELERVLSDAVAGIRRFQAQRSPERRLYWNRVVLYLWPPLELTTDDISGLSSRLAPAAGGLGIERISLRCHRVNARTGTVRDRTIDLSNPSGTSFMLSERAPSTEPLAPLDEYTQKVVRAQRRGLPYPFELIRMVSAPLAGGRREVLGGSFDEHDLDTEGRLVRVERPPGCNRAAVVVGVVRSLTDRHPEGMARVMILGDPSHALGSLAEAECRRIISAIDLAAELEVPVEWFALSAGAKIAMDSGTENMDWIAAVLRRIVEFTQDSGEINVVVAGVNVGAQPYWNAEATMLMHTKGILVMTPESSMVLTGKQALDYSGGVSAKDNFGIGGFDAIMGPNGQAQYWTPDLHAAIGVLLAHYDHTFVARGERFPRRSPTSDPVERDVCRSPHHLGGSTFTTVGDIFSDATNPGRKLPFDMRSVMRSTIDQDHEPLERWGAMRDADTAVVWDAHLGGQPVALLGIESHPLPRRGPVPSDGPAQWTAGTLFPMSSKKLARAINAASGNRPVVVLANLSGFDGSPDSMRSLQLELGAEIGRAVVNFRGSIVFCVISRFHGGAFVVFSQRLNEGLETLAVEGSRASVIGGAPAAAVVFVHEVASRTQSDPRVADLEHRLAAAEGSDRAGLQARLALVEETVRSEKRGEIASQFDQTHTVERALRVGSISQIIPARRLRPLLIEAVDRGMRRFLSLD